MFLLAIPFTVASYQIIVLLANNVLVIINSEGIKYEGRLMKWETIVNFSTSTCQDAEIGNYTSLYLHLSDSHLAVVIDITSLNVDEVQIREFIAMYSTKPEDNGHSYIVAP